MKTQVLAILGIVSALVLQFGMSGGCSASAQSRRGTTTIVKELNWPAYGGAESGDHYSPLTQINQSNVAHLRVAWTFDTGERNAGFESSPLIVDGVLYGPTPSGKVVALNATTGKLLWTFDPGVHARQPIRGLSYWKGNGGARLFEGVMQYVYAIDARTGKGIPTFGEDGRVDLRKSLGRDYRKQSLFMTSPGAIYKDLIIVGAGEPETHPAPPGDIRAYDVISGKLRWDFRTIPHPGEDGYQTWPEGAWKTAGSANAWAGMAVDEKRGIVYVPTGSAVFDFYGGDRVGNDLYSDSLLALNAATGKRIWSFQDVHHDLWDRDFPSPPALVTVNRGGKRMNAVAQLTKQGYLYLFNRVTGKPLFPIVEERVPKSTVPGEVSSPTQPRPLLPMPYARQILTKGMLTTRTPQAHAYALQQFKSFLGGTGSFVPLSLNRQTIVFPGFDGGAEWGGPAVDPETDVIYINANDMAWTGGLIERNTNVGLGEQTYEHSCSVCHGVDRRGSPPAFPSLVGIGSKLTHQQIKETITHGKGRMPPFPAIAQSPQQMQQLVRYLTASAETLNQEQAQPSAGAATRPGEEGSSLVKARNGSSSENADRYQFTGYRQFVDREGYPAIQPPWGTLNAISLNTGKYLWTIPLGEYPKLAAQGMKDTGSENYGGPVVTAGGLVFIGATVFDHKIRAFNKRTGKLLWDATLPSTGAATLATYMVNGKQYIVIAAGGSKLLPPAEAEYVAFTLP